MYVRARDRNLAAYLSPRWTERRLGVGSGARSDKLTSRQRVSKTQALCKVLVKLTKGPMDKNQLHLLRTPHMAPASSIVVTAENAV